MSPEYVNVVPDAVPTCEPPRKSRYPTTPTLSDDADHDNVAEVCPTALVASPVGVDGADVSGHAVVVTVVVAVADTLPAASSAATPSVYDVPHSMPVTVKLVDDDVPTCVPERNTR